MKLSKRRVYAVKQKRLAIIYFHSIIIMLSKNCLSIGNFLSSPGNSMILQFMSTFGAVVLCVSFVFLAFESRAHVKCTTITCHQNIDAYTLTAWSRIKIKFTSFNTFVYSTEYYILGDAWFTLFDGTGQKTNK